MTNAILVTTCCCPEPTPLPCCLADGTCQDMPITDCIDAGGRPIGGTLGVQCSDPEVICPGGACCHDDGLCTEVTSGVECIAEGGVYQGDGSICGEPPCPVFGACCHQDGTCTNELIADCQQTGDSFQGGGILCSNQSVNCPQPPGPGACCYPSGACMEGLSDSGCIASGGLPQGTGTNCNPNICPPPENCGDGCPNPYAILVSVTIHWTCPNLCGPGLITADLPPTVLMPPQGPTGPTAGGDLCLCASNQCTCLGSCNPSCTVPCVAPCPHGHYVQVGLNITWSVTGTYPNCVWTLHAEPGFSVACEGDLSGFIAGFGIGETTHNGPCLSGASLIVNGFGAPPSGFNSICGFFTVEEFTVTIEIQ